MSRIKYFLMPILLFSLNVFAGEMPLKILQPSGKQAYQNGWASFVIKAEPKIVKELKIEVGGQGYPIELKEEKDIYCKSVPLSLGINMITVKASDKNGTGYEQKSELYFTSPVHKEFKYPPMEFADFSFHTKEQEKFCQECHNMVSNEKKGVAFEDVTQSNCYGCHKQITSEKFGHAPAVNWLCTSCHNHEPDGRYIKADSKYPVIKEINKQCYLCHEKKRKLWLKKKYQHEPMDVGRCNKCHNPHASSYEKFLRKPEWELCTSCHLDKIEGKHVISSFRKNDHPTHNVKDPSRPGKNMSCISCHNPHASDSRSMLDAEGTNAIKLCSKCHKK